MAFAIDNRFCIGASGHQPPDNALVAYGARWIDQGDTMRADIVPDRQGFAFTPGDHRGEVGPLIDHLLRVQADTLAAEQPFDVATMVYDGADDGFRLAMKRTGGYVYVDAWLVAT